MKKIKIITVTTLSMFSFNAIFSQNINWANLKKEEKHILNINSGWEYSFIFGIGYGYKLESKTPIILDVSYSFPSGKTVFDDFIIKTGGQINIYNINNLYFNASVHGSYRRTENPLAILQNFGCDISTTIGYYKPKWLLAGEIGFDKAIVTHFKHTAIYKEVYPDVKNGWYEPTTGGNFNFGIQGGYSFNRSDITIRAGKVMTEDFKTTPLIPFYVQLGYNYKLD